MDLPVTAQTLTSRSIKVLHLEPTDVCQLACPLCARELDQTFNKDKKHHLNVEQILKHLSISDIAKLEKMFMCGNYGDPAAGQHTLEIYQWFRSLNPEITLGMNTNGSLRSPQWWENIASLLNKPKDYVVFSIDGLKDTNHIYRVNSNWDKLIENITAFISAGGNAHWDMLVYQHNEHQISACEDLARSLGFKWFRTKVSRRPFINNLAAPIHWAQPVLNTGPISCFALTEQSIYIDACGRCSPCCWLGARQQNFITDVKAIQDSWKRDPYYVCQETCATANNKTTFLNQWQCEIEL